MLLVSGPSQHRKLGGEIGAIPSVAMFHGTYIAFKAQNPVKE